jgi:hypothetical protein
MTKFTATLFSLLMLNLVTFPFAQNAKAEDPTPSRETTIGRLIVPVFKGKTTNKGLEKFWINHKTDIQKSFIKYFNAKASFETIASNQEFGFDTPLKYAVGEAQHLKGDGILIGEFQGQSFEFQIRSVPSGRLMTKMSAPIPDSNTTVAEVVISAVSGLIAGFGYDGYIMAVHKNEAKISTGKNQGVKVNDTFDIFDFDGDSPNFSSPVRKIGNLKVTRVADFASLGTISANDNPVPPFSKIVHNVEKQVKIQPPVPVKKVDLKPAPVVSEKIPFKVSRNFWVAPGLGYFSLTTQVPSSAPVPVQLRSLQAPLSPAFDLGFGISRLTMNALYSSLSNSSNTVSVLQASGLFQFYTFTFSSSSLMSSAGIYYSAYGVTPSANPTTLLVSSSTLAPTLEECYQWTIGPKSNILAGLDLYYVNSTDATNGSGSGSLGYGFDLNWRTILSQHLGLNVGARAHLFNIQVAGVAVSETELILSSHLVYLF